MTTVMYDTWVESCVASWVICVIHDSSHVWHWWGELYMSCTTHMSRVMYGITSYSVCHKWHTLNDSSHVWHIWGELCLSCTTHMSRVMYGITSHSVCMNVSYMTRVTSHDVRLDSYVLNMTRVTNHMCHTRLYDSSICGTYDSSHDVWLDTHMCHTSTHICVIPHMCHTRFKSRCRTRVIHDSSHEWLKSQWMSHVTPWVMSRTESCLALSYVWLKSCIMYHMCHTWLESRVTMYDSTRMCYTWLQSRIICVIHDSSHKCYIWLVYNLHAQWVMSHIKTCHVWHIQLESRVMPTHDSFEWDSIP